MRQDLYGPDVLFMGHLRVVLEVGAMLPHEA